MLRENNKNHLIRSTCAHKYRYYECNASKIFRNIMTIFKRTERILFHNTTEPYDLHFPERRNYQLPMYLLYFHRTRITFTVPRFGRVTPNIVSKKKMIAEQRSTIAFCGCGKKIRERSRYDSNVKTSRKISSYYHCTLR